MCNPPARAADHPVAAVVMLIGATLLFATQDALTKHLVQTLAVPQIVAVRFFFFALFAVWFAYHRHGRGAGDSVTFVGTLLILRPGGALFQPIMGVALLSASMFALYNILTRKAAVADSTETSLLYVGVVGLILSAALAPFYWQPVGGGAVGWLLMISCTSIAGHLLLIKALALAPAVILQPLHYFTLVWAALIGFLVYGEVLPPVTLIGAAIVVGSGVFIARREYQLMRRAPAAGRLPL